jgi:hypothetical protein
MPREVGTALHIVSCDGIQTPDAGGKGPLYHYVTPVADLMATGIAPKVNMPYIYTEGVEMGTGDTTLTADDLYFSWSTGFGFGGEYEIWATQDSTWLNNNYKWGPIMEDNEFTSTGMPATGHWFWKVRAIMGADTSVWSTEYCFTFTGTAAMGNWVYFNGVSGKPPVATIPQPFVLNQNRPNPVNGTTEISFNLPRAADYSVRIYNIAGQVVSTINGRGNTGNNSVYWNSKNVSNGVYLYQLNAAGSTATRKMVVVK